jgi:predicted DNA-binding mobile mystery protein A
MARQSTRARRLEISRLDKYFDELRTDDRLPRTAPAKGWINTIRKALGMSVAQLANRLGVTRAAVYKLEEREVSRSITLKQLDKAANEMDCDVIYTLIPRTSLETAIRSQSEAKAKVQLRQANRSMSLEAEGVKGQGFAMAVASATGYSEALADRRLWED